MRRLLIILLVLVGLLCDYSIGKDKEKHKKGKRMARYYLQHAGTGAASWASDDVLNPSTGAFTISFWFTCAGSGSGMTYLMKENSAGNIGYAVEYVGGYSYMSFAVKKAPTSDIIYTTSTVNDSAWHHLVAVRGSDNYLRLYLDGVLESTSSAAYSLDLDTSDNLETSSTWGVHNTGAMDEIRFYKGVALEAYQIANIYNSGFGVRVKENGFPKITSNGFYASCDDGSETTVSGRKLVNGVWSDHNGSFTSGDLTWVKGGIPLHSQQLTSDYEEYPFYVNNTSKRIQYRYLSREAFSIREFKLLTPQILGNR